MYENDCWLCKNGEKYDSLLIINITIDIQHQFR